MTHLRIEQNNGVIEEVSSSIITKLYEIAHAGLDMSSNLLGRLHTPVAYRYEVLYLTEHFPDLFITLDDYAIPFEDPNMVTYLNSIGVGSGGFVTESQASAATIVANSANTTVTKFNELKYFTNITQSKGGWTGTSSGYTRFTSWTALEEIDISNFTSLGHVGGAAWEDTFRGCTSLKTVTASDKLIKIGYCAFDSCKNLEHILGLSGTILVSNSAFYNCSKLPDEDIADVEFEPAYEGTSLKGSNAFEGTNFTEITLSPNTTKIPSKMFYNCSNLETVNGLGSNITEYNDYCFVGCTKFTGPIDFTNVTHIGSSAFTGSGLTGVVDLQHILTIDSSNNFNGTKITSVNYHGNTISGFSGLFNGCKNLITASGMLNILAPCGSMFSGCTSLTSVDFNWNNVTNHTVSQNIFRNCSSLLSIDLTGATSIKIGAFYGCTNLSNLGRTTFTGVTELGTLCFADCTSLTGELKFPDVVTFPQLENGIRGDQFRNCTGITKVLLGSITSLSGGLLTSHGCSFYGCASLVTVDIGSSLTRITTLCFNLCPALRNLIIRATTPPELIFNGNNAHSINYVCGNGNVKIYVPDASVNNYKTAAGWSEIASYIQSLKEYTGSMDFYNETFTNGKYQGYKFGSLNIVDSSGSGSLPQNAFNSCINLTNVTLEGISSIGVNAFGSCTSLESINLDGVTINGDGAFIECTSLTTIGNNSMLSLFPNGKVRTWSFGKCSSLLGPFDFTGITEIGGSSFERSGLSGVLNLPDVVTIGSSNAFGSTNITKAIIGDSITSIGGSCFNGCTSLTEVDIDFSNIPVANLGNMASFVSGCTSLQTFDCTGLQVLANGFFLNCTALTSITGLNNVTTIGSNVFGGCNYLQSVDINWLNVSGNTVPNNCFSGCSALTSIDITGATTIGAGAFKNCTGLTSVTGTNGVSYIDKDAFNGCTNLSNTFDFNDVNTILESAFRKCKNCTFINLDKVSNFGLTAFSNANIPTSVQFKSGVSIGMQSFEESNVQSIEFLGGGTIGHKAFLKSKSLISIAFDTDISLSAGCFQECSNLQSVDLSNISEQSLFYNSGYGFGGQFAQCVKLSSVILNPNLTKLPKSMFAYCGNSNLELTIPAGVTEIGENFLYGTNGVKLTVLATTPPTLANLNALGGMTYIKIPAGTLSAYQSAQYWSSKASVMSELSS